MPSRRFQLLAKKLAASMAAVSIAAAPPVLSLCRCEGAASADDCCSVSEKSCCGDQGDTPCNCFCLPTDASTSKVRGCSCSASSPEFSAATFDNSSRVVDPESGSLFLPAIALVADRGMHGVAWSMAFDLEAPGGPSGVRLHALLSVWRN